MGTPRVPNNASQTCKISWHVCNASNACIAWGAPSMDRHDKSKAKPWFPLGRSFRQMSLSPIPQELGIFPLLANTDTLQWLQRQRKYHTLWQDSTLHQHYLSHMPSSWEWRFPQGERQILSSATNPRYISCRELHLYYAPARHRCLARYNGEARLSWAWISLGFFRQIALPLEGIKATCITLRPFCQNQPRGWSFAAIFADQASRPVPGEWSDIPSLVPRQQALRRLGKISPEGCLVNGKSDKQVKCLSFCSLGRT